METERAGRRLWEIDVLRTVAMVLMVVFHVVYDINFLTPDVDVDPYRGGWRVVQVVCGSTFLTVVGLSFWVAHARGVARGLDAPARWRAQLPRALEILGAALLVSLATRVALGPDDMVRFGILHLIAALLLLVLPAIVRLGPWNVLIGVGLLVTGLQLDVQSSMPGAMAFGFEPPESGVDWYPLLPWGGAAAFGLALGAVLYPDGRRGPLLRGLPRDSPLTSRLGAPGRHSLPFYLVHQPVLIVLLSGLLAVGGAEIDPR